MAEGSEERWGALAVTRVDRELSELRSSLNSKAGDALREWLDARDQISISRLNAMDKAVELLQKFPTEIDIKVGNLRDLHQEKFESVGVRLVELNTRLAEGDRYKQTALDAALKAAQTLVDKQQENNKESIKKTEELFTKQIESMGKTIEDLKGLVLAREGGSKRSGEILAWIFGAGGLVYAIAATVGLLLFHHS